MADNLGIMLTELPEATNIGDNDLMYIVQENNSEKVKVATLRDAVFTEGYEETTGNPITITNGSASALVECKTDIEPIQDLHGYEKPWNGGTGKNKADGRNAWNINASGEIIASDNYAACVAYVNANTTYTFSVDGVLAQIDVLAFYTTTPQIGSVSYNNSRQTFTSGTFTAPITGYAVIRMDRAIGDMQVEVGSSATAYEPYSNICPITGHDDITINVSPTSDTSQGVDTTIQLGDTYYGGTLNVGKGELTVTYGYIASYNGETLTGEWLSDRDEYTSGGTPTTGAEVVYELATPITVQLTPAVINTLSGHNVITSSTGELDIVYVVDNAPIKPNPSGTPDAELSGLEINGKNFEIIKELPAFPTSNGNYKLKLSISNGVPTLSWVSDT